MQHAKMGQVTEKNSREEKEDKEGSTCNEDMKIWVSWTSIFTRLQACFCLFLNSGAPPEIFTKTIILKLVIQLLLFVRLHTMWWGDKLLTVCLWKPQHVHKAFLIADWSLNLSNGKTHKNTSWKSQIETTKGKKPVEVRKKNICVFMPLLWLHIISTLVCALC